jgi:phosphate acetyltransferase
MMTMQDTQIENVTFDELRIGQSHKLYRTLTQDDVTSFALVSGDINPAHLDEAYAKGTQFHGVIGHGMFSGALISALLGVHFPGPGTIYLQQNLRFLRPVHLGDTLEVSACVTDKDTTKGNVTLSCEVRNQRGETVVTGEALVKAPKEKVSRHAADLPSLYLFEPEHRLDSWIAANKQKTAIACGVVHPCDESSLQGALDAHARGLITPVIVAPRRKVEELAARLGFDLKSIEIIDTPHSHASADKAAELAATGKVGMLMKGSLHTDEMMGAVLAEKSLRTGRRMSHVFRFEVPSYHKPLLVTDAAINIAPDLQTKADIIQNAVDLAIKLGVKQPKVALLAAVETVTSKLGSTLDAAALCKMSDRGQIKGALLDGPLAFDNAISEMAAQIKGIKSEVAGDADILVAPDLEAANMLAKQLEYLAGAAGCGVVLGARVPIALTSRADTAASRAASALLAALYAGDAA